MKNNQIIENIHEQINKGTDIAPFLFLGNNKEIIESEVVLIAQKLCKKYQIPCSYFHHFQNQGEKIKIQELQSFLGHFYSKPPYRFQIFYIPNISALTLSAGNSILKMLEEPGVYNIIFLSDQSESGILDTILSRVQSIQIGTENKNKKNLFFIELIENYISGQNTELIEYFFEKKNEKSEYISFLENLILYAKQRYILLDELDQLQSDIEGVVKNNFIAKHIVDKWILKL